MKNLVTEKQIKAKEILMLAGGTGITPLYQILLSIFENDMYQENQDLLDSDYNWKQQSIKLLFANHSHQDLYLNKELLEFQK